MIGAGLNIFDTRVLKIVLNTNEYEQYKETVKENAHVLELDTDMDIQNPLIEWYMHRFASTIQTPELVHHVLAKCRRHLARLPIVHRFNSSDH